jgi:hypothetical protein
VGLTGPMTGNPGGIHTRWPRLNGARLAGVDRCRRCGDLLPGVSVNSTLDPSPRDGNSGDGDPHYLHMDLDQDGTVKLRAAGDDSGIGRRGAVVCPLGVDG